MLTVLEDVISSISVDRRVSPIGIFVLSPVFSNMSCTFEAGFCQWKNMRNSKLDQFDWTLWNGSTPSRNTGPSNDHTLGTSRGM